MKLSILWNEFKKAAYTKIKEKYPNIVNDDTVEFIITRSGDQSTICEIPDAVIINLEDKPL